MKKEFVIENKEEVVKRLEAGKYIELEHRLYYIIIYTNRTSHKYLIYSIQNKNKYATAMTSGGSYEKQLEEIEKEVNPTINRLELEKEKQD